MHNTYLAGSETEKMRISSAGNVGIGTTNPAQKLHISGGNARIDGDIITQPTYKLYLDGGLDTYITEVAANTIGFNTGGSEKVRINSSGNVGIGTTSPAQKLDVNGVGKFKGLSLDPKTHGLNGDGRYHYNVIQYRNNGNITGAFIINTDIARNSNRMSVIHVHGYAYGDHSIIDFKVCLYPYSGSTGPDGDSGSVINYSMTDNGNDGKVKFIGIDNLTDNVSIAIGDYNDASKYFWNFQVDWYNGTGPVDTPSWSVSTSTTNGFGWIEKRTLTPPLLSDRIGITDNHVTLAGTTSSFILPANHYNDKIVLYAGGNEKIGTEANTLLLTADNLRLRDVSGTSNFEVDDVGTLYVGNKVQAGSGGIEIWDATHGFKHVLGKDNTYTYLKNNDGVINFYAGDSGDATNYYDNGGHRFRSSGGGTTYAYLNSTGLAIGHTSPAFKLDVRGSDIYTDGYIRADDGLITWSSVDGSVISLTNDGTYLKLFNPAGNQGLAIGDTGDARNYYSNGAHRFRSYDGGTNYMEITSAGNVGIGTTILDAGAKLNVVSGSSAYTAQFSRYDADDGLFLHSEAGSTHYNWLISTQDNVDAGFEITPSTAVGNRSFTTPAFVIKANTGNVGIGTNSPPFKLKVNVDNGTYTDWETIAGFQSKRGADTEYEAGIMINSLGDALGGQISSNWYWSDNTGAKGNTGRSAGIFGISNSASNESEFYWQTTAYNNTTLTTQMKLDNGQNLHVDGDVVAYSTSVSDKRLKDNIKTIDNALDKVMALRGVEFDWNATSRSGQHDIGLIAQEVEEVIPEVVREKKLQTGEFTDNEKTFKTIDYDKMVGVLVEAIKEQQQQINELKEKLNG